MESIKNIDPSIKSHFLNLFTIALADSSMDPIELKMLYNIGLEKGIKKEEIDFIIDNPHKIRFEKPHTVVEKIEQLFDLIQMLLADGVIDPREITICSSIAEKLGFKSENIPDIIDFLIEEKKKDTPKEDLLNTLRKSINE